MDALTPPFCSAFWGGEDLSLPFFPLTLQKVNYDLGASYSILALESQPMSKRNIVPVAWQN
jgi:hypothetical protein